MQASVRRPFHAHAFRLALGAGVAILGLAGCSVNPVGATGSLVAAVPDTKSVVVSNGNGNVELVHDPAATTMQITAAIRCTGDTEEKAAARVKVTKLTANRDADGEVRIAVDFPPRDPAVTVVFIGTIGSSEDSASIVIRAADLDGIEVATTNGSIDVGAFRGPAKLVTSNGSIEVRDHAGPIEARSTNGAIRASGVLAPIVADTSNGRIEVALAPEAQGDVELDTSNGSVSLELGAAWQGTVRADTSNGKVDLAGGEVVRTVGETTMTIGDATKARATIDTSNGRINVRTAKK